MIFRFFFFLAFQGWEGQTFLYDTCFGFFAIFFDFFVHFFFFVYVKIFFLFAFFLDEKLKQFLHGAHIFASFHFLLVFFHCAPSEKKKFNFSPKNDIFLKDFVVKNTHIFTRC